jgi:predicted RNA polymerase sigma factor
LSHRTTGATFRRESPEDACVAGAHAVERGGAAREDEQGNLLRLEDQNRALGREMIMRGMSHLGESAAGHALSEYHLQAGIAAACRRPKIIN